MSWIDDGQDAYYDGEDIEDAAFSPYLASRGFVVDLDEPDQDAE